MRNSWFVRIQKHLLAFCALGVITSCRDADGDEKSINRLASNDFETVEGWVGDVPFPSLTTDKAHSGKYSVRVGPGIEYSTGYSSEVGKVSPIKLTKMKVRSWVYLQGDSPAILVTEVKNATDEKPLLWDGLELAKATRRRNEWVKVEKEISLPADIKPTTRLKVYLWSNGSNAPVYIDDLQIIRAL